MRTAVVLCLFALVTFVAARPETYTDRFDNVNVQEILNNRRLLTAYILCALEKGKCTNDGRELRSHIKEALENNCGNCTQKQRSGARTVIAHLINKEKGFWNDLTEKYDPEHKYVVQYEKELTEFKE